VKKKTCVELVASYVLLAMVAALEVVGALAIIRVDSASAPRLLPLARGLATIAGAESLAALFLARAAGKLGPQIRGARSALALGVLGLVLALAICLFSLVVGMRE
jgi:hypothetical protein